MITTRRGSQIHPVRDAWTGNASRSCVATQRRVINRLIGTVRAWPARINLGSGAGKVRLADFHMNDIASPVPPAPWPRASTGHHVFERAESLTSGVATRR